MALTTLANVRMVPGLGNVVKYTDGWLNMMISATDATIKRWTKQNIELAAYVIYMSGNEMPDLVMPQFPVWSGATQIAAGSNGVALPTATINVVSTLASDESNVFDPAGRSGQDPSILIKIGTTAWTVVTYTGKTSTSFTGCSGGTGTLSSADGSNGVSQPVVAIDFTGAWGQRQPYVASDSGPFADGTLQVCGANFAVSLNRDGSKGKSGLLTRIGGYGAGGWHGSFPSQFGGRGKLAAGRRPCWPMGQGNIKVRYSAGYEDIPGDITYAATTVVSRMVRSMPIGQLLASESLGAYSYSILAGSTDPEIGDVRAVLRRYTEVSW